MNQELKNAVEKFKKLQALYGAYNHVLGVTYLDASTSAPKGSYQGRGRTMGTLTQVMYDLMADPENEGLFAALEAGREELDLQTNREVEAARKAYSKLGRIPAQEYVQYNVLLNEAQAIWETAKNNNDFSAFAPYLQKIVDFNRKFAGYYDPNLESYDALLNEYEEGLTMQTLDAFFEQLRQTIVPLLEKIQKAQPIDDSFLFQNYPVAQQRKFSDYLMDILGLDRNYCGIAESEHPFTTNFNNRDVRITTHYYEDNLASSMYSVIHEGGHALYELGCDEKYNYTFLSGGVSMGIHESQSRFYENIIGRSKAFVSYIYPEVCRLFPQQMADVTPEMLYRGLNKAQASLVRTEADELTYSLHIMIRYEIEKMLIGGTLEIADVPAKWNELYEKYLGIQVPNDTVGCLQDTHWAGGMIGYFPSYALGSAYGPQLLHVMQQQMGDVWQDVAAGDLCKVRTWLQEKIHTHASFYKPGQLFRNVCGEFDPSYYTAYLRDKFTELYGLDE